MIDNLVQRKVPKRRNPFGFLKVIPVLLIFVVFGVFFFVDWVGVSEEFAFIAFLVIFVPVMIGISVFENRQWKNTWRTFAERSGFTYEEYQQGLGESARVTGTSRGYPFQVDKFTRGSGKYKKTYTSIRVRFREIPEGALEIKARNIFSSLGKAFQGSRKKMQYVEVGDMEFDRKLLVKATSEQFARAALSSMGVRQGLLDIRSQTSSMQLKIAEGELYYHELNVIMDGEYLTALVNLLVEFAESVERHRQR